MPRARGTSASSGLGQMGGGIARALDRGGRFGTAGDVSPSAIAAAQLSADVALMPPSAAERSRMTH